jgi:regulator of protease activity HflC (stomatin/prohibitin superfamily)
MGLIVVVLVAAIVIGFALMTGIRIVPQGKVMVVERLGKYYKVATSGLNILIPFLDSPRSLEMRAAGRFTRSNLVDMREQVMGFETVPVITHDNVTMEVGSVLYYQIIDPQKALYQVENLSLAIEQLAMTNLRNVMGELTLDQTLTSRETVNAKLRTVLDEATEKWGVKVTRVEMKEIEPPQAIKAAMAKQMTAERERRAEVTKAEGDKSAAILQAEGEKISRVLRAEAERDSSIALAEGRKKATIMDAEGKAESTRLVFDAINAGGATPQVLALRYLETLQAIGQGTNKVFVPYEASATLGALGTIREMFADAQQVTPAQQLSSNTLRASPPPVPVARPVPPRPTGGNE